ncbi:MAG: GNAT family N-acetyltransferase [Deltaproteobacteria bacterium]|nr:GNAT family N-acetyltransferase [Deltaproteobacteria bacterium]
MNADAFSIRRMMRSEIDIAIDWAEAEGWNPGIHDADCFYAADPNGFLIGLLDNEPVAMVSAVTYGESYGFMGFYIVKPEVRNRNYGVRLWDEGLRYLQDRCIGLDSVRPDLVSRKKPEFKPCYSNHRFRWLKSEQWSVAPEVIELSDAPFSSVMAYDGEVFGFSRETFLKCWMSRPGARALGFIKNDKLSGYGVIRECREGFKIGPLFADNAEFARALFEALTRDVKMGRHIYLDTPERNPEAVIIAKSYGMTEVFRTTRMYNRREPAFPLDKWFGVTTFELG